MSDQAVNMLNFGTGLMNFGASQTGQEAIAYSNQHYAQQRNYENMLANMASEQLAMSTELSNQQVLPTSANIMRQQAESLKERMTLFDAAARLKAMEMEQFGREADFILAQPLEQLGTYAGMQNWGSFYAARQALVQDPLYARSREVKARVEAIDQMTPHWGGAVTSTGEVRSFLDVSKELGSPDWSVRKEALRIMALKSENPTGFIYTFPGLTPMQMGELITFIKTNPLVTDEEKMQQYKTFEATFRQKLLEATGNDFAEYTKRLADPDTIRQMEDGRRALLYGRGNNEPDYVSAQDRILDTEAWEQLRYYMNDLIDDNAGYSITRAISERATDRGKKRVGELSDEDRGKIGAPRLDQSFGEQVGDHASALGGVATRAGGAALATKFGGSAVVKKVGTAVGAKALATNIGVSLAGAPVAAAAAVTYGAVDAGMYYMRAGRDIGALKEAITSIKQAQVALQGQAAYKADPNRISPWLTQLSGAIDTVNVLSQKHNLGISVDINNVISRQVAAKLQGAVVQNEAASAAMGTRVMPQQNNIARPARSGYDNYQAVPQ